MNLYLLLGVRREATADEIRRAFRRLARKYHPDVNPGDRRAAEMFRQISVAYETLVDPDRRRRYEVEGQVPGDVTETRFEFQGFDFSVSVENARPSTFWELFADELQARVGATTSGGPQAGPDLEASASIGFEESIRGARRSVTVTRLERCAPCTGLGRLPAPEVTCPHCDGAGEVRGVRGHMVFTRTCAGCGGSGVLQHRICAACGGEGVGVHTGPVVVAIPAGVQDGAHVLVPGEGHAGRRGGAPGVMRLTVHVQAHPFFCRRGDDLAVEVPLAIHEAALGARIEVPTVDGVTRLMIPPGTQAGDVFRIRGRGVPRGDGGRGDMVVTVRLVLPDHLDERSRDLLREFGERNPENVRDVLGVVPRRRAGTAAGAAPHGAEGPRPEA